jgi:hypothetical protein
MGERAMKSINMSVAAALVIATAMIGTTSAAKSRWHDGDQKKTADQLFWGPMGMM